ncbi:MULTISPECIES: UDP-galactopyranose mutase [Bombella]|uniref:UDP-galactopyranose mutase n=1 Tax=Bombella pollinis TaxID=2967337 RepID=A0ABT3WJY2_9PROT|nr:MULTISPECIES: UDP-galactopyranose mutase [Bombella]MCX5619422.1 UDP-galactopyranose mutase [Bombella pollinis]MUG04894.1 UDP-galactopyranose mutase [Bombella sp. ESL0378]MUG90435.1 UDP-galactopyranose mutase [Bombella sp. ESL0385]
MKFCVIGAGFSGTIISRHLALHGHDVLLLDERPHLAGNCHTSRDPSSHIMLHHYGPHIFHTAHHHVWEFITQFGTFRPYINRVKAIAQNHVFSLPINLMTINQFYKKTLNPQEAEQFIYNIADKTIKNPSNFEEQAISLIGKDLYNTFFRGYTRKQWGMDPKELPASILKRLPIRFNYDDNYFNHPYQGIPEQGYTALINSMLLNLPIDIQLNTRFEDIPFKNQFDHIFYTGPLDRYFNYAYGRLPYRTLDFEKYEGLGDYQGTAVINYCDEAVPYTRIAEHKHFTPWEAPHLKKTVWFREYSRLAQADDAPYYPIRLAHKSQNLAHYIQKARATPHVSFLGRLGTYRYLDMDVTINEALQACQKIDHALKSDTPIPSFFIDPS